MVQTQDILDQAAGYMRQAKLGGWLIFDYQGMNPVLRYVMGHVRNITRPVYLLVTPGGQAKVLAHHVDMGRFARTGFTLEPYQSREDLVTRLRVLLGGLKGPVAMEYSPMAELPRASRVDAGTVELVGSFGVPVVSSADLFQYATQRWDDAQFAAHQRAATLLGEIVLEAFQYIGANLGAVTEHEAAEFIRRQYARRGLEAGDGPVVAAGAHSSDPHFEPSPGGAPIGQGQWVLIDLWAREPRADGRYADITWVGYTGDAPPSEHAEVFELVCRARDKAVETMGQAFRNGRELEGWEVDRVARDIIQRAGYGRYFTHRLGHSLGETVHGDAVNLDSHETHDTRKLLNALAVTIEPGVYLPDFGMRSEIDVFLSDQGPLVTTPTQRQIVRIG